jgi:hypothetical protein
MKATRIHMPCRECHIIHANTMSSTLCSDCGIKLRKENEELEAFNLKEIEKLEAQIDAFKELEDEWIAFQKLETEWVNTL